MNNPKLEVQISFSVGEVAQKLDFKNCLVNHVASDAFLNILETRMIFEKVPMMHSPHG
jgi:hypothetical protein